MPVWLLSLWTVLAISKLWKKQYLIGKRPFIELTVCRALWWARQTREDRQENATQDLEEALPARGLQSSWGALHVYRITV